MFRDSERERNETGPLITWGLVVTRGPQGVAPLVVPQPREEAVVCRSRPAAERRVLELLVK